MLPPWLRNLDTLRELREYAARALETKYSGALQEITHFKEGRAKTRKTSMESVRTVLLPEDSVPVMAQFNTSKAS